MVEDTAIVIGSDSDCTNSELVSSARKDSTISNRSWVYSHAEKLEKKGQIYFYCRYTYKSGKKCDHKALANKGNTSTIAHHLKEKHHLKPPPKVVQPKISDFNMGEKKKQKTFREAFAEAVVKQYLPYSIIEERAIQDSYLAFLKEFGTRIKKEPIFVTDKTVAADISKMADIYVNEMSKRFKSKLSLCMDIWTGPNKMSFLGITFTFLDDDFKIQRGLLEMIKLKKRHTGYYIADLFEQALNLYSIDKEMIGGVTQDNASNAGSCVDALVVAGFDRQLFFGCFLHILNLACQAAIEVYDPFRKNKTVRTRLVSDLDDFSGSEDSQDEEDEDFEDEYAEELRDVNNLSNVIVKVT